MHDRLDRRWQLLHSSSGRPGAPRTSLKVKRLRVRSPREAGWEDQRSNQATNLWREKELCGVAAAVAQALPPLRRLPFHFSPRYESISQGRNRSRMLLSENHSSVTTDELQVQEALLCTLFFYSSRLEFHPMATWSPSQQYPVGRGTKSCSSGDDDSKCSSAEGEVEAEWRK